MSRKQLDRVAEEYYIPHMLAGRFKYNPDDRAMSLLRRMHARTLTERCSNRFEWKGFPPTVNLRYLEMILFNHALVVYFEEPGIGGLALAAAQSGPLNMYGDPTGFHINAFTVNRYVAADRVLSRDGEIREDVIDGVPIWANHLRQPDLDIVEVYATSLAELDRTIQINLKNARRGKIITVGKNQILSATNIVRQIDEGAAVVTVDDKVNVADLIHSLDLGVDPDTIEKLSIIRSRLMNEASELLGINNANQDKKERLVASEVDANDEQVQSMKNVALNERRRAAEKISKRFGIEVTVDFYKDEDGDGAPDATPKTPKDIGELQHPRKELA